MLHVYYLEIEHPQIYKQISFGNNLFINYQSRRSDVSIQFKNNFCEILFSLSGKQKVHVGEKCWDLCAGQSLLLRKTAYIQKTLENEDGEILAFHFNSCEIADIFQEFNQQFDVENLPDLSPEEVISINVNPNIRTNFYSILPLMARDIEHSKNLIKRRVKELMINILAEPDNIQALAYFNHSCGQQKIPITQVMENNFMINMPIVEFARLCQRSKSSFKNDFRKCYNTSPGKWLLEKRLSYARILLENSSRNISEVADKCGFENISHFSRVFKEKYGTTPSDLRRKENNRAMAPQQTIMTS